MAFMPFVILIKYDRQELHALPFRNFASFFNVLLQIGNIRHDEKRKYVSDMNETLSKASYNFIFNGLI